MDFDFDEEDLDPRISGELENLNSGTNEINSLEQELERANTTFRLLLTRQGAELECLGKKIGTAIDRARPFYVALAAAQHCHRSCLRAAAQFQRANGIHGQAKALVKQAEMRNPKALDSAWQEVLNHATMKVMEAEEMKKSSESNHRLLAEEFTRAERRVQELERRLSKEIEKSRPYFELKDQLNADLDCVKTEIENLQEGIAEAKRRYARSLKRLESISEEIHTRRNASSLSRAHVRSDVSESSLSSYSTGSSGGESSQSGGSSVVCGTDRLEDSLPQGLTDETYAVTSSPHDNNVDNTL